MVYTKYTYKSKAVKIRDAKISDAFTLAENLREADKKEIWRAAHHTPEGALVDGYTNSILCYTYELSGEPIAMFGVAPENLIDNKGYVWLLASPKLEKMKKSFLLNSAYFIHKMLECYPLIFNYVDIDNLGSIRWLEWCGAEFGEIKPYGAEQTMFQYFQFVRRA